MSQLKNVSRTFIALFVGMALTGCILDDDDDPMPEPEPTPTPAPDSSYSLTLVNLTANQPLSPPVLLIHDAEVSLWASGMPASEALEKLAEGGDASAMIALDEIIDSVTADAPLGPGASLEMNFSLSADSMNEISLATMLVNTNDAFTGLTGLDLTSMTVGDSRSWLLKSFDAGTEANDEMAANIPGPAGGGEGYNAERDDVDRVFVHAGVLSQHERANSALDASHRFDNPVLKLSLTRTE